MTNFSKTISTSLYQPWKSFYIDYRRLKHALYTKKMKINTEGSNSVGSTGGRLTIKSRDESFGSFGSFGDIFSFGHSSANQRTKIGLFESNDDVFRICLDEEIEKCVLFFLKEQGLLASRLFQLRTKQAAWANSTNSISDSADLDSMLSGESIKNVARQYREVGEEIVLLVRFAELNITAIRKILKKHDKYFNHRSTALSMEYLSNATGASDAPNATPFQQFCHFGGLAALSSTLRNGLKDALEAERLIWEMTCEDSLFSRIDKRGSEVNDARTTHIFPFHDAALEYEPILDKVERARARLNEAGQYTRNLAVVSLLFFQDPHELSTERESETGSASGKITIDIAPNHISRFLNLASAFLYMTNYYIVAPTSGNYAAILGGSQADTALIIGMTPLAAQFGAVLYSWWANRSYKSPLIFAAVCSVSGNLIYSLALSRKSLKMVLAGRLLNGFGGARAINRRYLADAFRREERTRASAAFVTGGALGMAAGPLLSSIMSFFIQGDDGIYLTSYTAPGWIMCLLWSLFVVITVVCFEEPSVVMKRQMSTGTPQNQSQSFFNNNAKAAALEEEREAESLLQRRKAKDSTHMNDTNDNMLTSMWTNVPVLVTLVVYFVLKMVTECLLSSTSILTKLYFNWDHSVVGFYLAVMGLLMFPTNLLVARYSVWYEDRNLILFFLLFALFGIFVIVCQTRSFEYSVLQYISGSIIIFCSANSLEGVNMSLLSKVIPKQWAKHGILNSGLLATESGTFGRTFASIFLTYVARSRGIEDLLNGSFVPTGFLVFITSLLVWKTYDSLEPEDDDEDEEVA